MNEITLYSYFRSSTSYRVRIALEIKNLSYTYKAVHLLNNSGEQNHPDYKKLNPMGGVPTLVHTKQNSKPIILSQSMAILEYLEEIFPDRYKLYPQDIFEKNKIRQFCENINADIHSYGNLKTLNYLSDQLKTTESQKKEWLNHWFNQGLKACEEMLINRENKPEDQDENFCFGKRITMAEIFLIPLFITAKRNEIDTSPYKRLTQVFNYCVDHEAFKKAHPFRQPDTPEELRIS